MAVKVQEAYEELMQSLRRSNIKDRTLRNYKSFLERFLKWTDQYNLDPLNPKTFVTYYFFEYYRKGAHESNKRGFVHTIQKLYTHAGMYVELAWRSLDEACQHLDASKSVPEDPVEFFHKYAETLVKVAVKPAEEPAQEGEEKEEEKPAEKPVVARREKEVKPEIRQEQQETGKVSVVEVGRKEEDKLTVVVTLMYLEGRADEVVEGVKKITHDFFSSAPKKSGT